MSLATVWLKLPIPLLKDDSVFFVKEDTIFLLTYSAIQAYSFSGSLLRTTPLQFHFIVGKIDAIYEDMMSIEVYDHICDWALYFTGDAVHDRIPNLSQKSAEVKEDDLVSFRNEFKNKPRVCMRYKNRIFAMLNKCLYVDGILSPTTLFNNKNSTAIPNKIMQKSLTNVTVITSTQIYKTSL